ncbi:class IV adenylate cyclase [Micromonospora taraxaci]|uniref:class IV adenylate cyclase n=1 Tax=Micromonospora taraxaci TaxID=1316803 RepID=UPI0033D415BD
MTGGRREVEIKARVSGEVANFLRSLELSGAVLSPPVRQVDHIFVQRPFRLSDVSAGVSPIVRIRLTEVEGNANTLLTVKRDLVDQLDCVEHEVQVSDAEATAAILEELGLHEVMTVRKVRRQCVLSGFIICLDNVENLGTFVELEASGLFLDDDSETIRSKMWAVAERLGIGRENAVSMGYDRLLDQIRDEP